MHGEKQEKDRLRERKRVNESETKSDKVRQRGREKGRESKTDRQGETMWVAEGNTWSDC